MIGIGIGSLVCVISPYRQPACLHVYHAVPSMTRVFYLEPTTLLTTATLEARYVKPPKVIHGLFKCHTEPVCMKAQRKRAFALGTSRCLYDAVEASLLEMLWIFIKEQLGIILKHFGKEVAILNLDCIKPPWKVINTS